MILLRRVVTFVYFIFFLTVGFILSGEYVKKKFVFVTPSHNNKDFYRNNLNSVFYQDYSNYRVIYIDDCSTDGTGDLVADFVHINQMDSRVTLIRNNRRLGALANIYRAVHMCDDDEILVFLDGDDWLAQPNVLSLLNDLYQNPAVWLTYGSYQALNDNGCNCRSIPKRIRKNNAYREYPWVTSHLKTAYAWLFKCIRLEDLLYQGRFLVRACDLAYMFPMLEMSGGRFKYIDDALYVYNTYNSLSHFKKNIQGQEYLEKKLRQKKRYKPLQKSGIISEYLQKPAAISAVIISQDNLQSLSSALLYLETHPIAFSSIAVLLKIQDEENTERFESIKRTFPDIAFINQEETFLATFKKLFTTDPRSLLSDFYLFCSDTFFAQSDLDIHFYIRLLKQTRAFGFNLSGRADVQYDEYTKDHSSLITDDVYAYQMGWPIKVITENDGSWACLLPKEVLFNNIGDLSNLLYDIVNRTVKTDTILSQKVILTLSNKQDNDFL